MGGGGRGMFGCGIEGWILARTARTGWPPPSRGRRVGGRETGGAGDGGEGDTGGAGRWIPAFAGMRGRREGYSGLSLGVAVSAWRRFS